MSPSVAWPMTVAWLAMPRSFDSVVESPASVEQVHSAFSDEDYWLARLASFSGGTGTLDSLIVDADRTVTVATTLSFFRDRWPGLVRQLPAGDLKMVRNERWSPVGDRQVRGLVDVALAGVPGSARGMALLSAAGTGSRLKFTTTVEVKVPVLGGTIESYVGSQLGEQMASMQRFTTMWITEHR